MRNFFEDYLKSVKTVSHASSELESFKSFEGKVTSVSVDDRHLLVGLSNGSVSCIYLADRQHKFTAQQGWKVIVIVKSCGNKQAGSYN